MRADIEMQGVETGAHLEAQTASLTRTRVALAAIDRAHSAWPQCYLCGQRAAQLDTFGLCSKVSASHLRAREAARR